MLNRRGLLLDNDPELLDVQKGLATDPARVQDWVLRHSEPPNTISLLDVVTNAKPTVLIGVSGQPGLFDEAVVTPLLVHSERPLIMPLYNPTSLPEARPADILRWTEGRAMVATGSPPAPVELAGQRYEIAQCNNSYILPGLARGVIAAQATRITDTMMVAARRALAEA